MSAPEQYSYLDALAKSVPELATLFSTASAQGWDSTRFGDALQATQWWQQNSDTARQAMALQAQEPAEYQRQLTAAQAHVTQLAAAQGVQLTQDQVNQQATVDLWQGLDDATLKSNLAQYYTGAGGTGGQAASTSQSLQALASQYGVPVTQDWINNYVKQGLTTGQDPTAAATQALVNSATSMYPGLAKQLAGGQTVQQIAQPYIAQMSQTLEIPSTGIDLSDTTIQKALQGFGTPAGNTSATSGSAPDAMTPLWQFTQQLKQDPRWQQTSNAQATAYGLAAQLGRTWGYST